MTDLIVLRPEGLYCPAGDFHIDPWRPVPRAVITHGHGDHARTGMGDYHAQTRPGCQSCNGGWARRPPPARLWRRLLARRCAGVAASCGPRAGQRAGADRGRWRGLGGVRRLQRQHDPTCAPFEVVPCDVFITEATFGLPIYRWPDTAGGGARHRGLARGMRRARRNRDPVPLRAGQGAAPARRARRAYRPPGVPARRDRHRHHDLPRCRHPHARDAAVADEARGGISPANWCWPRPPPPAARGSAGKLRRRSGASPGLDAIRGNRRRRNYDRGLRGLRPCRLAGAAAHRPRDRRAARHRHPWRHRRAGPRPERRRHRHGRVPPDYGGDD